VTFASKALEHASGRLQHGAVGFRPSEVGDAPLANACHGLVAACGGLGTSLGLLADVLSREILEPLHEVERAIEEDRKIRRAEMVALEQQEMTCSQSAEESAKRRSKADAGLQTLKHEQEQVQQGGWFFRKTLSGKLDRQVGKASLDQNKAVQDMAQHMDQLQLARSRKAEGVKDFQGMITKADGRLKAALQPILLNCARAWKETADAIRQTAGQLQKDAAALSSEHVGDHPTEEFFEEDSEASPMDTNSNGTQGSPFLAPVLGGTSSVTQAVANVEATPLLRAAHVPPSQEPHAEPAKAPSVDVLEPLSPPVAAVVQREVPESETIGQAATVDAVRIDQLDQLGTGYGENASDSSYNNSCSEEDSEASPKAAAGKTAGFLLEASQTALKAPPCLEFVAGLSEGPLGLKLSWPPGQVLVQAVLPGGWAETCGLQLGAEIIAVNGDLVAPMQQADFRELLKKRPLSMSISLPPSTEAAEVATGASAREQVARKMPIDRV